MLVTASAVAAPPTRRRGAVKTSQKPKTFFTIHTHPNHAFTLKLADAAPTSVVGFGNWDDALFIGKMIETHFERQKEWPDTREVGTLTLPASNNGDVLHHIYIQKWDFDELKLVCTKNFLDLVGVEGIIKKKSGGYTFDGNVYRFKAEWDFYRARLAELWMANEDLLD